MRLLVTAILACAALSACTGAPGTPATSRTTAQLSPQPAQHRHPAPQTAAAPPPSAARLNLDDYIYGPPPRTRVDRRLRCRFDCPKYPPGTVFDPP